MKSCFFFRQTQKQQPVKMTELQSTSTVPVDIASLSQHPTDSRRFIKFVSFGVNILQQNE